MDFPFVVELLEYWLEYPPVHLLLRGLAGYKGQSGRPDSWRAKRAEEMGDQNYRPEKEVPLMTEKDSRIASEFITGARHLDCAPGHIQQAVERVKKGKHLEIPKPEEEATHG
jgi:hypothetical protein